MARIIALLVIPIALAGCAGIDYAMTHYTGVDVQQHNFSGKVWRVFDKPRENRLMITPSIGDSAAGGAARGLTLGISGRVPEGAFRVAAEDFLASTGRDCAVIGGGLVLTPQYEFFYDCG